MDSSRLISVAQYHEMIERAILTTNDRVELLEGVLVERERRSPQHDTAMCLGMDKFLAILPAHWDVRIRCAITLSDSEPEPDLACVRGDESSYLTRHPGPSDFGVLAEVADSSLEFDRTTRGRIYARAAIVCYWIINLIDNQIEVYTSPSGSSQNPTYDHRTDYRSGDQVPLILDGGIVASIPVDDILP
jgi:Uma2 family endonuclease